MKNTKPKIVTIIGARPQFIKAAVVSPVLSTFANEIMIHTGQHFDSNMSDIFFQELSLPEPHYHLDIHSGSHADMTGRMLIEIEKILMKEKPDLALVYGDTNSTLAGALAAAKLNIPIAHIEAGMRSYNRKMPEEINRILTDQLSAINFVTSESAANNLKKEGFLSKHIYNVGDVMYDLALKVAHQKNNPKNDNDIAQKKNIFENGYILVTLHRSENTDNVVQLQNLKSLIEKMSEIQPVLWVMHPRTQKAFQAFNILPQNADTLSSSTQSKTTSYIKIIEPVGYQEMMGLIKNSFAVATDSGGLQKEAFYFKKPCITLRNETEWFELSDLGWNLILGQASEQESGQNSETDSNDELSAKMASINAFLNKDFSMLPYPHVYGDGMAAEKIGQTLKKVLVKHACLFTY